MKNVLFALSISVLFFAGCAQKEFTQNAPEIPKPLVDEKLQLRSEIIAHAIKYENKKDGIDCSGYVSLVNQESNEPFFKKGELNNYYEDSRRSLAIYNLLSDQNRTYTEKPKVGDLIFFANTVKRYSKTKSVDNITHIGIITRVDSDATVHFIHHTKGKNLISQMNINYPTLSLYNNKVVNSYMEKCPKNDGVKCLAPEYFSAYGEIQ